jgi:AcrR family transcriptional regulator
MFARQGAFAVGWRRMGRAPRSNAEWTAETTARLIAAARAELAARGYAEASVERIAARVGLTKGALYYHFGSKQGLFRAAFRDVERDIVERIEARARARRDPVDALVAGCEAFLDVALDDELRQIALLDAPSVLGWREWRAIDEEFGLGSLREGLAACVDAGALVRIDIGALAHLLSGAMNEAVFLIAEAGDRAAVRERVAAALRRMIAGLRK